MKQFNNAEQTGSEAARNVSGRPIPLAGVYAPNYKGVNQVLYKAGGEGTVAFYDALAVESSRKMKEYQGLYDNLEIVEKTTGVNRQLQENAQNFRKENPSGQGYVEFITSTHDQLAGQAMNEASNSEVAAKLRILLTSSKSQWANQAFQDQIKMTTSYAVSKNETNLAILQNQLIKNPDNYESLSDQYEVALQAMRPILPAAEYEKYRTEQIHNFVYSHGIGLIHRDPIQAKSLIDNSEEFTNLPGDGFVKLMNMAESKIRDNEAHARVLEHEEEKRKNRDQMLAISELHLGFATGTKGSAEVQEYYDAGRITEIQKNNMLTSYSKTVEKRNEKSGIDQLAAKHMEERTPAPEISSGDKTRIFMDYVRSMGEQRGEDVSFTEQVQYAKDNSLFFDSGIPSLTHSLAATVGTPDNNASGKQILDACIAINGNQDVPAIKGLDDDIVNFASMAVTEYFASHNLNNILKMKEDFFKEDRQLHEYRKNYWQETYGGNGKEKYQKLLNDFYKENGFFINERLIFLEEKVPFISRKFLGGEVPLISREFLDAKVGDIIRDGFLRTGSITKAKIIAANYMHNVVRETNVNGKSEFMINPPRKENTGMDDGAIKNWIYAVGQNTVDNLTKSGVPIRRKGEFVSSQVPQDLFARDVTRGGMEIEVKIGDKWEDRPLRIDSTAPDRPIYNFYYFIDEEKKSGKEYLYLPKSSRRAVINFDKLRGFKQNGRNI
jgi:hypothetical protein